MCVVPAKSGIHRAKQINAQMDEDTRQEHSGLRSHVQVRMPAYLATLLGGVVAMGVNAPLRSPDDLIANASSVGVVSIFAAVVTGMIWGRLSGEVQQRSRTFNIIVTVLLLVVVGLAWTAEYIGEFTNTIRYVIPLAGIVTIFSSVFTPIFERWNRNNTLIWVAIILTIAMLVAGYWLTVNEFGFTEAPSLALPPPPA